MKPKLWFHKRVRLLNSGFGPRLGFQIRVLGRRYTFKLKVGFQATLVSHLLFKAVLGFQIKSFKERFWFQLKL